MPITADLTIRETAALSGFSKITVAKSLEVGILCAVDAPARLRGGATRYLPIRAVAYFSSLKAASLTDFLMRHKRVIREHLVSLELLRLEVIEFARGTVLDLKYLAADSLCEGERYREARKRYITSDADILGGTPVIRGTRLTVYAILARLQGGDTVDDLEADYPELPREAFMAAALYAHPLLGRPSGRPWRNVA